MAYGRFASGFIGTTTLARLTRVLLDAGLPIRGANTRLAKKSKLVWVIVNFWTGQGQGQGLS